MGWLRRRLGSAPPLGSAPSSPPLDVDRALDELEDVGHLFAAIPWHELRRFEQQLRRRHYTGPAWFPQWHHVRPGDASVLAGRSRLPATVGALLSMHGNGFVRQEAVDLLARSDAEELLPFLAVRTGDWVPEVRLAARRAMDAQVNRSPVAALIRLTPLLEQMAAPGARTAAHATEVLDHIASMTSEEDLASALGSTDVRARRWCARQLAARRRAVAHLSAALAQGDATTARIIGEASAEERPDDGTVLDALAGSKVGALRGLALHRRQVADDPAAMAMSELALCDTSPNVRFLAQRYLADRGVDVRARYRSMLEDHPRALSGFAEVAQREDLDVVLPFLDHELPSVRSRATSLYGRLTGLEGFDRLLLCLQDPSPSVSRSAARALAGSNLDAVRLGELWQIAEANPAARTAVFALLLHQDRWTGLSVALRALAVTDHDLNRRGGDLLVAVLERWQRSFTAPRVDLVEEIRELLGLALPSIDEPTSDRLTFAVRPFLGSVAGANPGS